jgi:hypothetical protein
MPVTYRKRIKLFPGLYLNVGRKSLSLSVKAGPFSRTYSSTGRRTTSVNLPGGAGYRSTTTASGRNRARTAADTRRDAENAQLRAQLDDARQRRDDRRAARRQRRNP